MDDFATTFGITMGQLVTEYRNLFAWLAPLPHIAALVLVYLVFRYGNRFRKLFTAYYILNYIWMLIFVGLWFSVHLVDRIGWPALAMYGATPILLAVTLFSWIQEYRNPQLDLDFTEFRKWRLLIAVPMMLWGFWYPPYEWGVGLHFDPGELLFGAFGLMGCPTTMFVLAILFLKYPKGNKTLYNLLTTYAVCIGAAMVALKYVPDIPFFIMGLAALGLILYYQLARRKNSK